MEGYREYCVTGVQERRNRLLEYGHIGRMLPPDCLNPSSKGIEGSDIVHNYALKSQFNSDESSNYSGLFSFHPVSPGQQWTERKSESFSVS